MRITPDKALQKDLVEIKENLVYIRTKLDDLSERTAEDRRTAYAHVQEDHMQFGALNKRMDRFQGGVAVAGFLLSIAVGLATLWPG